MTTTLVIGGLWIAMLALWVYVRYQNGPSPYKQRYWQGHEDGQQCVRDHGYDKALDKWATHEIGDGYDRGFLDGIMEMQPEQEAKLQEDFAVAAK